MNLKEEYCRISDKEEDKLGKKIISDDAYAVCEFIENLIKKIEHVRVNLNR